MKEIVDRMTKTPELLPCPFCDCQAEMTVDQFGYDETCCIISCVNCLGRVSVYDPDEDDAKERAINIWNNRVFPKETDLYIHHPVTGERMDKSQCKRVITQLYGCVREMDGLMKDRDQYLDMANKLADAIAKHFDVEIGEHSNMNCPWENALEWIYPITPERRFDGFYYCNRCGQKLENWDYCPNCGQRLNWREE